MGDREEEEEEEGTKGKQSRVEAVAVVQGFPYNVVVVVVVVWCILPRLQLPPPWLVVGFL